VTCGSPDPAAALQGPFPGVSMSVPWLLLASCKKDEPSPTPKDEPSPLLGVEESAAYSVPGADGEAWIVRTPYDVPYVYATTDADLARATGFVVASDRYFVMDLARRLARGQLSEVLGQDALSTDLESRGMGMTRVADLVDQAVAADPLLAARFDAYAEGVNLYVAQARTGALPLPTEIVTLSPFLGVADPTTLLSDFDRADLSAIAATLVYNLGFETTDVGRTAALAALDTAFDGAPSEALREAGARQLFEEVAPTWPVASSPGFAAGARRAAPTGDAGRLPRAERSALHRLRARADRWEKRLGHDRESGWGSNAWAVAGDHTADGRALLAGDGHLDLSIPSLFYSIGLDDAHLAGSGATGERTHQVGLVFPGFPTLAVGTNGRVAWGQTQLMGDITDWYADELVLDGNGVPRGTIFEGEEQALERFDEVYEIRDVPLLGSEGRTETWPRWQTFDGRLVVEIEGTPGVPGDRRAGRTLVAVGDAFVFPEDLDGDGVVSAFSVDHTAFDPSNLVAASDGFGHADDVGEFREATRKLVAYSQNLVAADADGHVLYTPYQAVPCRSYLPRGRDGRPLPGADPTRLLDGTKYRGFTIPVLPDGTVDESQGDDPYRCVVPFAEMPVSQDPPEGFVMTANNDIGGLSLDGDLWNDAWYVGGPWLEGYRAKRLVDLLGAEAEAGTADVAAMSRIQGDHHSVIAEHWLDWLLEDLARAEALAATTPVPGTTEERAAALYLANEARLGEARDRLQAWRDGGLAAASGVETPYDPLAPGDEDDSVATMVWNAWVGVYVQTVLDDEGFPTIGYPTGDTGRTRTITAMLQGRGPGNPQDLASWDPDLQESVYFDVRTTPEVEESVEIAVLSLVTALDVLTAPTDRPGYGGFGTDDMDEWRWGYRHLARMESILSQFLDDEEFGFLTEPFSVSPDLLPLGESLPSDDPRAELPWFPRDGDHLNVDAGNPGFDRYDWTYGSGPVFRMVVALGPDGWSGVNVLPGGQSGLNTSPHFADQAPLWLGNQTFPMLTSPDEVAAVATSRVVLRP
jgi:penicillin amidase